MTCQNLKNDKEAVQYSWILRSKQKSPTWRQDTIIPTKRLGGLFLFLFFIFYFEKNNKGYEKVKPYLQNYCTPPQERKDVGEPPAYKITPYSLTIPVHRKGGSVHPHQRESLMYLTKGLPEDSKQTGEAAALYAWPQERKKGAQGLHGNRCHTPEWSHTKTVPA